MVLAQPSRRSLFLRLAEALIIAAIYYGAGRLGLSMAIPLGVATPVWAPSGIGLAAILLRGNHTALGVWLGSFLINSQILSASDLPPAGIIGAAGAIAMGSTAQALLASFLIRRFIGPDKLLDRSQDVFKFVGLAALSCLTAATVGLIVIFLSGLGPSNAYSENWVTWYLGDLVGVIIVTPFLLSWSNRPQFQIKAGPIFEGAILLGLLLATGLASYLWQRLPLELGPYAFLPFIVWSAIRFGPRWTTLLIVLVAGGAIWGTIDGLGPFTSEAANEALLSLQTFLGIVALTGLCLTAVLAQRQRAEDERSQLGLAMEQERATLDAVMASMSDGLLVLDGYMRVRYCNARVGEFLGINPTLIIGQRVEEIVSSVHQSIKAPETACSQWENFLLYGHELPSIEIAVEGPPRRDLMVSAFPVTDGTAHSMGLLVKDVTSAKAVALLEERERIAMNLHDGVIQSLYAVALGMSAQERLLGTKALEARQTMQRARRQVNNVIQEIRNVIFDLRQHGNRAQHLQAGLKTLATELGSHASLQVNLELGHSVVSYAHNLIPVEHILYIAREATSNALRHSGAREVMIRMEQREDELTLTIRDDGCGFDQENICSPFGSLSERQGLRNMAERAQLFGGQLRVVSSPAQGTEVSLKVKV